MALTDEMYQQGAWLFRWRSFLPIVLLAVLFPASLLGLRWPFGSYGFHLWWEFGCLMLSFAGMAIRCATVGWVPEGTSGRGTLRLRATTLNTTGLYSIVRHPLYLGNYLIGLGVTLVWFDWWAPLIYSLFFWLYYERIMLAEERYLESIFGDEFRQWAARTPPFVPRFSQWQRPALRFSIKTVLKREYTGILLLMILHAGMELIEHAWLEGRFFLGPFWLIGVSIAVLIYVGLSTLKKRTQLLHVAGR